LGAAGLDAQKKHLASSERGPIERANWRADHAGLNAADLVALDESGANLALALRYGWAPKGERSSGQAPCNRGANTTLLAAMTPQGLLAAMTVEGAANTEVFLTYLDEVLCSALRPGQVVLLDNLSMHKNAAVRERIEACGCQLIFLPRYSPDFNPIEGAFSKLKASLRRAAARTREALEEAIAAGLATITASDAQGWFTHCGYHSQAQPT
jgi:transposase